MFSTLKSKAVIILSGLTLVYSGSALYFYDLGKRSVKPKIETKIETKTEQKTEYVDRVITRTVKGDTVTEVIHEKGKTEVKTVEKEKIVRAKNELSRYSVAGYISFDPIRMEKGWEVTAGARLGNLPVFIEAGATSRKEILVGLKYEF